MRVAIYCRVSTEEQRVDTQESICREYCLRNGYSVYQVYKDVISGTKSSRPEFNELLADMRAFKFDAILITRLDRLTRSLKHLLSLIEEFNSKGIFFICTSQPIDTSSAVGRLNLSVLGAIAEFERSIISERTKEGLRKAVGVGKRGKDKKPRKRRGGLKKKIKLL